MRLRWSPRRYCLRSRLKYPIHIGSSQCRGTVSTTMKLGCGCISGLSVEEAILLGAVSPVPRCQAGESVVGATSRFHSSRFLDTVGGSQNRLSADINPTNRFLNPGRLAGIDPHSPIETSIAGDDAMAVIGGSMRANIH